MRTRRLIVAAFVMLCVTALVAAEVEQPAKIDVPLKNWPIPIEKYLATAASATPTAAGKVPLHGRTDVTLPSKNSTFIAVAPCREYDSRSFSILTGGTSRTIPIAAGPCAGIPSTATAFSLNVAVFGAATSSSYGFATVYPTGTTRPTASTINYLPGDQIANAAIVPAGTGGAVDIYTTTTTHFVIDINGYTIDSPGTLASSAADPSTLVLRDGSGDFAAHNITANQVTGAVYQDLAEWVPSANSPEPGTVVVLDPQDGRRVMASTRAYDTAVAGVVSAMPAIILGPKGPDKSQVATTGRVDVFVDATKAPIAVGDLLVTSDTPGMAMKSVPVSANGALLHRPGTIIGKALEPLASGQGKIKILLSLQ